MRRFYLILLSVILLVVVGIRIALPYIVKHKVNQALSGLPDYRGHVKGVHLAFWRGGCTLKDLEIEHKEGDFALTIQKLATRVHWGPLFKRQLVADVDIVSPRLRMLVSKPVKGVTLVKEKTKDVSKDVKAKTGKSLPDLLADLYPFQVRHFYLTDGTIRLQEKSKNIQALKEKDKDTPAHDQQGRDTEDNMEARVTHLDVKLHNLTNTSAVSGSQVAKGTVTAQFMQHGQLKMGLTIDPTAKTPTFDVDLELSRINLVEMNPLFHWQWGVDAARGEFAMYMEAAAKEGGFRGYVKPFLHNVEMHDDELDKHKKLGAKIKEVVVDIVNKILENPKTENVAMRIPFEGRFDNPAVGVWEAIWTVLRNAFIKALSPRLDHLI